MRSRRHRATGEHTLSAVLVESVRVNGAPRQKIVGYLGSIGERRTAMYFHQRDFWDRVKSALDGLELTKSQRRAIEAQLKVRVPYPTATARKQALRQFERLNSEAK